MAASCDGDYPYPLVSSSEATRSTTQQSFRGVDCAASAIERAGATSTLEGRVQEFAPFWCRPVESSYCRNHGRWRRYSIRLESSTITGIVPGGASHDDRPFLTSARWPRRVSHDLAVRSMLEGRRVGAARRGRRGPRWRSSVTGSGSSRAAVADAMDVGHHLVAEAPTGSGKSLAYLAPAVASGLKVVVATSTIALQQQLVGKDLPALRRHGSVPFTFALLKGRSNYVCRAKLRAAAKPDALFDQPVVAAFSDAARATRGVRQGAPRPATAPRSTTRSPTRRGRP